MPHIGIHAISARQNKINKRWGNCYIFCCRTAAISAPFTPLSIFRFQPLPAVATHGVDVDITFHYVTSQFSAFGRLGVARRSLALLGDIDACKSRRSQISALLAGFAALVALAGVGSHNVQQQLAQVAEPWGGPLHPITIYKPIHCPSACLGSSISIGNDCCK